MARGPADDAGLRPGDVITAIDGNAVDRFTFSHFYLFMFGVRDGQEIRLTVRRGNDTLDVVATAVDRSAAAASSPSAVASEVAPLGIMAAAFRDPTGGTPASVPSGVLVMRVSESSGARELFAGDVIYSVNGHGVSTPENLTAALTAVGRAALVLQIERNGRRVYVAMDQK
jgi:serine protease Do